MEDMEVYFSGKKLYGDDFNIQELEKWYKDEKEGYADLGPKNRESYIYAYHELNQLHGFRYLKGKTFNHALGLGSAYGEEFLPIIKQINQLTICDPSDAFVSDEIHGVPSQYVKPSIDGILPFEDNRFDLITCFGVLACVANVTTVVNELCRCLSVDGIALIREPIVSMGDWTKPREHQTIRGRGIPWNLFQEIVKNAGFEIKRESLCVFAPLLRICRRMGFLAYNNKIITKLDSILSDLFRWNIRYHPANLVQKFRPVSVYYVLTKRGVVSS